MSTQDLAKAYDIAMEQIVWMEAEIERLKAALRELAECGIEHYAKIARAALEGGGHDSIPT
jgi:hypothetical protein